MDEWLASLACESSMMDSREQVGDGVCLAWSGSGWLVTVLGGLDSRSASASPIKGSHHRYDARSPELTWRPIRGLPILLAGPKVWSSHDSSAV